MWTQLQPRLIGLQFLDILLPTIGYWWSSTAALSLVQFLCASKRWLWSICCTRLILIQTDARIVSQFQILRLCRNVLRGLLLTIAGSSSDWTWLSWQIPVSLSAWFQHRDCTPSRPKWRSNKCEHWEFGSSRAANPPADVMFIVTDSWWPQHWARHQTGSRHPCKHAIFEMLELCQFKYCDAFLYWIENEKEREREISALLVHNMAKHDFWTTYVLVHVGLIGLFLCFAHKNVLLLPATVSFHARISRQNTLMYSQAASHVFKAKLVSLGVGCEDIFSCSWTQPVSSPLTVCELWQPASSAKYVATQVLKLQSGDYDSCILVQRVDDTCMFWLYVPVLYTTRAMSKRLFSGI